MRHQQTTMLFRCAAILVFAGLLLAFAACTSETYKSGDGDYSYLRGDFSVLTTNSQKQINSFVTDDNTTVTLAEPVTIDKIKADTTYRALVYYNKPTKGNAKFVSMKLVNVCKPFKPKKGTEMKTDPTGWESIWISENNAYLNLGLKLLVGVNDDENADTKQVLGVCQDYAIGRHFYLTLYHDQKDVPQYYTYTSYVSIPLDSAFVSKDTITMTVNTYDGIQSKTVVLP